MQKIKNIIKRILPNPIQKYLRIKRLYYSLPKNIRKVIGSLKKDNICVDCGANIGQITELFSSYGCIVHSFEPNPFVFQILKERFSSIKIINLHNSAVGIKNGESKIYLHKKYEENPLIYSEATSLISKKNNVSKEKFIYTQMINLGNFLNQFEKIKILKIDIEGYETILIPWLIKNNFLANVEYTFIETHEKIDALKEETAYMKEIINEYKLNDRVFCNWP
tara:strand:+ start:27 stop:692 length:666 start_codon:yes stop_codon:yes gene_type:complete